jgi:arylformamidase
MTIYDVSMEIRPGMLVWPGDDGVELDRTAKLEDGAHSNLSRLRCGTHTGTHVDAPLHFLPGGKTVDALDLDALIGPAWIADLAGVQRIRDRDLEASGIPAGTERLLLKTDNSERLARETEFRADYAGLDASGAEWIVRRGIRLLGSDYLSIAVRDLTSPVHRLLLEEEVILVEGLCLAGVPSGLCRFYCLPLKLKGAEGALARAVVEMG